MSSLYSIVEDSGSRLVLRGREAGLWILTAFLLLNGFVLLYVGLFMISRRQLFLLVAATALGIFFAVCGVAAGVWAARYRSRIEIDRDRGAVRLTTGQTGGAREVPFTAIASVDTEARSTGSGRRRRTEHRLFLQSTDGSEWLIDRSSDAAHIAALASRVRDLTHANGARAERPAGRLGRDSAAEPEPSPQPAGVSIEADGDATVYRWRTLPRSGFWVFFWIFVTLFVGTLAGMALAGMVSEMARQPPAVTLAFLALAIVTLALMYTVSRRVRRRGAASLGLAVLAVFLANLLIGSQPFIMMGVAAAVTGLVTSLCLFVLLARCRLRVSAAGVDYEERMLGLPLLWRRRALAAEDLEGFRIKAAVRGGGAVEVRRKDGGGFTLMIPQGRGAFSRRDLEWLRQRWREDLLP